MTAAILHIIEWWALLDIAFIWLLVKAAQARGEL